MQPSASLAGSDTIWSALVDPFRPRYRKIALDQRRSTEHLLPGTPLRPTSDDDRVPILLVRRPNGWTLLAPEGSGMLFWPSLVAVIPRVGGQREQAQQAFERGQAFFPNDAPTTTAGDVHAKTAAAVLRGKWERRQPKARVNHDVLGTASPFAPDWSRVVDGSPWLLAGPVVGKLGAGGELSTIVRSLRERRSLPALDSLLVDAALVRVRLTSDGRGVPRDNAAIYDAATALEDSDDGPTVRARRARPR